MLQKSNFQYLPIMIAIMVMVIIVIMVIIVTAVMITDFEQNLLSHLRIISDVSKLRTR